MCRFTAHGTNMFFGFAIVAARRRHSREPPGPWWQLTGRDQLAFRHFRKLQAWPKDFQANPMHIRCKGSVPYCSNSIFKPKDRLL
jgi:hypothetical protein